MNVVKEHTPRNFTSFITNSGVVLCDDQDGAFLCLRFPEDLARLRALLAEIEIRKANEMGQV